MRLADFILANMEEILVEWEAFARTLVPAANGMSTLALRNHAAHILKAVAKDIATPQTRHAQSEKSKGRAPIMPGAPETAAQVHAVLRAREGFDIKQLVAEYRALRASVLRLWMDDHHMADSTLDDVMRFNEAIDQAVAESVGHFHAHAEQGRNLLLGMLGHDMRSPLSTILATASQLAALNAGGQVTAAADRLIRSGRSLRTLLDDLVDFNRTKLGLGINISATEIDLAAHVADELEQLRGAYADRPIELEVRGDCRGLWDGARVQQALRNLVSNAVTHGAPGTPVRVMLHGDGDHVRLEVANYGSPIDAAASAGLFEPLQRGARADQADPGGLGLGLFIVREISRAHGGDIVVDSRDGQTTFTVDLPRRPAAVTTGSARDTRK